jgi:hypothetical protein
MARFVSLSYWMPSTEDCKYQYAYTSICANANHYNTPAGSFCRRFRLESIRHCLNLFLVAHDYQAPSVKDFCMNYLSSNLPTSLADIESVEHYRRDIELAGVVIWVSELHKATQLIPWAFYMLSVQTMFPLATNGPNPTPPYTRAVCNSYAFRLRALQGVIATAITKWNTQVTDFYKSDCSLEGRHGLDECCRRDEDGTLIGPMLIEAGALDPLKRMSEIMDAREGEVLCTRCKKDLRSELKEAMESVYANICSAVCVGM